MAAIRMMFSWLTEKGILAINPAREVKTPKFSRTEGKTPAFSTEEVQSLPGALFSPTKGIINRAEMLGARAVWRLSNHGNPDIDALLIPRTQPFHWYFTREIGSRWLLYFRLP